jgi:hypothetical protein
MGAGWWFGLGTVKGKDDQMNSSSVGHLHIEPTLEIGRSFSFLYLYAVLIMGHLYVILS